MKINEDLIIEGTNHTLEDIPFDDVYSTTETKTNKFWIDGKPIYRKVIYWGSMPTKGNTSTVAHGVTDINILTFYRSTWYDTADNRWSDDKRYDSETMSCYAQVGKSLIYLASSGTDWSVRTKDGYTVMEYTKTTD